jgi:prevent-host-death family protein
MTATEAARAFSDVLNRVAAGEQIEVTRSGAPVAVITPPRVRLLSAERFHELIATAPAPDEEVAADLLIAAPPTPDEGFAADLRSLGDAVGPPEPSWPS